MFVRVIMTLAIVATFQVAAFAHAGALGSRSDKALPSMRFAWHSELPTGLCRASCRRWVSAAGPITDQTPADFQAFAAVNSVRGATLVLDSGGGSVAATLEL